jgi:hypothetical protein
LYHFKTYYTEYVQKRLNAELPHLISYARFIQRLPSILAPLCVFLQLCFGRCTGDRKTVPALVNRLFGKLFGDKGYLSKPLRNQLMCLEDKLLLRKRTIIETVPTS